MSLDNSLNERTGSALLHLKKLIQNRDLSFFQVMRDETRQATQFGQVFALHNLRRRAEASGLAPEDRTSLRVAVVGGPTLRPLADLIEHFTEVLSNAKVELQAGEFDSYISEIRDPHSELYDFKPEVIFILPLMSRCQYAGSLADPVAEQRIQAETAAQELLDLGRMAHERSGAEVVICNFNLPPYFDPGPMRSSSLGADYGFRKYVNMQLGLNRPNSVHICDAEFLANRIGTQRAVDERAWFESKQPFSVEMVLQVAREFGEIVASLRRPPKKVLVMDLDNTLWGGVIGDDGIEGIEIGTTSPRGEAFRHFLRYKLSTRDLVEMMAERGVVLCTRRFCGGCGITFQNSRNAGAIMRGRLADRGGVMRLT
jgi:predicted enzyme involved in methoxymalonyl-ACP biosynthesis